VKHDMTAPSRQGRVEQVNIKSKCGHIILLDTVNSLMQYCVGHSNMLETVICWTSCILDSFLVLLFQVINIPSKYAKIQNVSPFSK